MERAYESPQHRGQVNVAQVTLLGREGAMPWLVGRDGSSGGPPPIIVLTGSGKALQSYRLDLMAMGDTCRRP